MTTILTPLDLYRERIPVARAAFDAAFGLLPVPQRRRDMARRLWQQVRAQVPEMPVPDVRRGVDGNVEITWSSRDCIIAVDAPVTAGGYDLAWWWCGSFPDGTRSIYSLEPLLRVCQRFVAATAREVR